jgi:hypothetical protein
MVGSVAPQHASFSLGAQHVLALAGSQHDSVRSAVELGASKTASLSFSGEYLLVELISETPFDA